MSKISSGVIALIVVVLIVAGASAVYFLRQPESETGRNSSTRSVRTPGDYTNGTYEALGNYSTPGGRESITISVTLADNTIETISATGSATGGNSKQYQDQFFSGYQELVVGKNVDEVELSRVAGSSLTSDGFNRALDQIKDDARR